MPRKIGSLHVCDGAVVEVAIQVSAAEKARLLAAGKPIPSPIVVRAALDTGASHTAVDLAILTSSLGLAKVDTQPIGTADGNTQPRDLFDVDFSMTEGTYTGSMNPLRVVGFDMSQRGVKTLIVRL